MDAFEYRDGCLWVEGARVEDVAREHGTPLYLYSKGTLVDHYEKLVDALAEFDPLICYSVKVNGNLSVLRTLAAEGSGFDLVSGGELFRALRAGGEPERFVFAGVGKTDRELDEALDAGIRLFTVESVPELETLSARAAGRGKRASVALRVNPDVDAHTHEHITTGVAEAKFGIDLDTIDGIFADPDRFPGVLIDGFHMHIGSQITETGPYALALERLAPLYGRRVRRGYRPPRPRDRRPARARARALHRRQRGRPRLPRDLREAHAGEVVRDRGRGNERPDEAAALRRQARDMAGAGRRPPARARRGRGGREVARAGRRRRCLTSLRAQ